MYVYISMSMYDYILNSYILLSIDRYIYVSPYLSLHKCIYLHIPIYIYVYVYIYIYVHA